MFAEVLAQTHFLLFVSGSMGGKVGKEAVAIKWGPLPKGKQVIVRIRSEAVFKVACEQCHVQYVVRMQPGIKKGAVYILDIICHVGSGKYVLLDPNL